MRFKLWIENNEVFQINIDELLMTKQEIADAVSNLSRGMPSMTSGPLEVYYFPSANRYQLVNGYHRIVESLMRGLTQVQVKNSGDATWRFPSKNELFIPDWDKQFFGMEDFIEYYELKRL